MLESANITAQKEMTVGLTSTWLFSLQKHTFLKTNWLGAGRFGRLFLSVYIKYNFLESAYSSADAASYERGHFYVDAMLCQRRMPARIVYL